MHYDVVHYKVIELKSSTLVSDLYGLMQRILYLISVAPYCNITQAYVDKDDPWLGILYTTAFSNISKINRLKCYSPGQLLFCLSIILIW